MPGAPISRWTMSYFAASLVFLVLALALMAMGFGVPSDAIDAPDTLVVVHLITVGWLGLLFTGALLQFVPVLVATHLRLPRLAAPALIAIVSGLLMLVSGFLSLGGYLDVDPAIMAVGAMFLVLGFLSLIASFSATILSQKSFGISGSLVLLGLIALAVTIAMGAIFAGLLSGILDDPLLASLLSFAVPYHAASGTLGWMTLTAIGVSYRLFTMFMLSPEAKGSAKPAAITAGCALAALYLSLSAGLFDDRLSAIAAMLSVALAAVLLVLYFRDVARMLKARRRKKLELNSITALVALLFLTAGMALLAAAMFSNTTLQLSVAAFYLLGLGWLSGLGLAQLYKIVPFLTWLEAYGAVMGRTQVPKVQDLVAEAPAGIWFAVYYVAVLAGAAAILLGSDIVFRAASLGQMAAAVALALEYFRARRLAYAPDQLRLPPGVVQPHLVYANTDS